MAYFPFFMDLSNRAGLIVGGGTVALRKVEALLPYGAALTVVAPTICPQLCTISNLTRNERAFSPDDLKDVSFVVAASNDSALNRTVSQLCQQAGIPVNVVDDKAACTFLFPALIHRGPLSIGITTGGASPTAAVWLKEQIDALLPVHLDSVLLWLEQQRPVLKQCIPDASHRAVLFGALFAACIEKKAPLTEEEVQSILHQEVTVP